MAQPAHLTDAGVLMTLAQAGRAWLDHPDLTTARKVVDARDAAARQLVLNGHAPAAAVALMRVALAQVSQEHAKAGGAMPSAEQRAMLAPIPNAVRRCAA